MKKQWRKNNDIIRIIQQSKEHLKCNGNDFNVDFEIKSKDAIVSHIEVKQDLVLTWGDIRAINVIINHLDNAINAPDYDTMEFYEEVLRRFNDYKKLV